MALLKCEISILSQDEVQQIHDASIRILEEIGMKIEHERMLGCLRELGAAVDLNSMIVKFPRRLVEDCMQRQVERANNTVEGAEHWADPLTLNTYKRVDRPLSLNTHMFSISISDAETEDIRPATLRDYEESVIVANELANLIEYGPLVIPNDVPQSVNDAYMWAIALKRSTKWVSGQIFNMDTIPYIKDMCVVAAGDEDLFTKSEQVVYPCLLEGSLSASRYSLEMAFRVHDLGMSVRFGVPMGIAGFSSPITLAGALTAANAEGLGSYVMAEAVGGKCYGALGGAINYNPANGATLYASPEKNLLYFALRDIAKFYGFRNWKHYGGHANCSDACYPGIQAGIEKGFSSMFSAMADAMYIHCGMLSPEAASIPMMVIDDEICSIVNRMKAGIEVTEEKIAFNIIQKAGIHGNYINPSDDAVLEHTVRFIREENYIPKVSVRVRPQTWQREKKSMLGLAKEKTRKILAEQDPHPLGDEKEKEIDRILNRCLIRFMNK